MVKQGFQVRAVAGSSIGGLMAVLFAAGYTADELETLFAGLDQSKFFGLSPRDVPALLGLTGAARVLSDLLGKRTFAELRVPCAVTATDIQSGQEVVLNQGLLVDAILATTALPGVFPPKLYQGRQLVDGGVIDPVPVSLARSLAPELPVVAVTLSPKANGGTGLTRLALPVPVPAPIVERLTRLQVAQAFGLFLQAVDAGGRMLAELRLQA
ncbi:MAG TPA: patatin-like phospholipase family protein, partial [Spirochaetia bacterium]|nr:patatin-like phospholipase family protein [Spirochaetia bacterium]